MIQAIGIKTNKIYARGHNKRAVNRQLIANYPGVIKGNNLCFVYPEPLIFKSEELPLVNIMVPYK